MFQWRRRGERDLGRQLSEHDEDFLVQPSQKVLDGQSPAGVNFTLTLYKDNAAAEAAFEKKNPKTTSLVENGVIDFKGNPSIFAGAPPAKISKSELSAIKKLHRLDQGSGKEPRYYFVPAAR